MIGVQHGGNGENGGSPRKGEELPILPESHLQLLDSPEKGPSPLPLSVGREGCTRLPILPENEVQLASILSKRRALLCVSETENRLLFLPRFGVLSHEDAAANGTE